MIFLTLGTYPLQFDRLVEAVDIAVMNGYLGEKVFAQIGFCTYKPHNMDYIKMLPKEAFDRYFREATSIISHAGIGSIDMALEHGKPLLVMPRLRRYGEAVNDHQVDITRKFEQLGHILAAYSVEELPDKLHRLKEFTPKARENQAKAVAERIAKFLELLGRTKIHG